MRPVTGSRSPSPPTQPASEPADKFTARDAVQPSSRSLVVVDTPARRPQVLVRYPRPSAPFLAHLIASAQQAPQTRLRRQAEPAEATARYMSERPAWTGQVLRSNV